MNAALILQETLAEHAKWLRGKGTGTHANLTGANLTGAYLTGANLIGAYLTRADLAGANLTDADLTDADLTCADLTRANLTRANLTRADLTGANMTGADLTGADLTGGKFLARASVQFSAHGECGRELSAIKTDAKENDTTLYCGCFAGTPKELREYIVRGDEDHVRTRTLALDTVLMLLEIQAVKS